MNGDLAPTPDRPDPRIERENRQAKGVMVLVVLGTMLFAVTEAFTWYEPVQPFDSAPAFSDMAQRLFGEFIIPFEVLGFLLLAALVGALYIAKKET